MSNDKGWLAIESFLADLAMMPDELPIAMRSTVIRHLEKVARQAESQGAESRMIAHALILKLYVADYRLGEAVWDGLAEIDERQNRKEAA